MVKKIFKTFGFSLFILLVTGLFMSMRHDNNVNDAVPPPIFFMIIWPCLFFLIALAAFMAIKDVESESEYDKILNLYYYQLLLLPLWSFLYTILDQPIYALIDLFIVYILAFLNIIVFYRQKKISALLLLPYFIFLTYAIFLNAISI